MIRILIVLLLCVGAGFLYWHLHPDVVYKFSGVTGPADVSVVPPPVPSNPANYAAGSQSRMAILLTDPNSAWPALAHGLNTIGVPFMITSDYHEALKHKVVYIYPTITGTNMTDEAAQAIATYVKQGGMLIGQHVLGSALRDVFEFNDVQEANKNIELHVDPASPVAAGLTDPAEQNIRIGGREVPIMGNYAYLQPKQPPVATYEDKTAAITRNAAGNAYAVGIDLGYLLMRGYDGRQQDIATHYVNAFEPTLDVLLRMVKNIYLMGEQDAVTLYTVPEGKSLAVLLTHDIDYTRSLINSLTYADFEHSHNITATYFMQVKYVRDWNDDIFFTDEGVQNLIKLQAYNVEIASHSIAHSRQYKNFLMGDGKEQYPTYVPFVKDKDTTLGGTILGELRVSKFLLEHFVPNLKVISFRPGHLSNPYALPEALMATGYSFSSSITADDSLTHLPYQLMYSRSDEAETPIFEFPLTIEDEADGPMINRLPQAVALANQLKRYGAIFNILIHPDIVGQKFDFEKGFVEQVGNDVWYGSVGQLGQWWAARSKVGVDVAANNGELDLTLTAPDKISGLALDVPQGMTVVNPPPELKVTQNGSRVLIGDLAGTAHLVLKAAQ